MLTPYRLSAVQGMGLVFDNSKCSVKYVQKGVALILFNWEQKYGARLFVYFFIFFK